MLMRTSAHMERAEFDVICTEFTLDCTKTHDKMMQCDKPRSKPTVCTIDLMGSNATPEMNAFGR